MMELLEGAGTETKVLSGLRDTKLRVSGFLNGLRSEFACCSLIRKMYKRPIFDWKNIPSFQIDLLPEYVFPKILLKYSFSSQF